MRRLSFVLCDVFTDRPLQGNQLAVFTDARGLDDATMQALAREMHFSETVFVLPRTGTGDVRLRIFTPVHEVPFAGHPTLGAAFVLGRAIEKNRLVLETGAGEIPVVLEREAMKPVFGWMTQPLPAATPHPAPDAVLDALGLPGAAAPVTVLDNGIAHVVVVARSREEVAGLRPDLTRLRQLPGMCFDVVAGTGDSWKVRVFAPAGGIDEDPATGSAAGPIAVLLARHGLAGFGRELTFEQGAEIGRPSRLHAVAVGTSETLQEVRVGGPAVVVGRGEIVF